MWSEVILIRRDATAAAPTTVDAELVRISLRMTEARPCDRQTSGVHHTGRGGDARGPAMRDVAGVICLILGGAAAVALVVGLLRPRTFARRGPAETPALRRRLEGAVLSGPGAGTTPPTHRPSAADHRARLGAACRRFLSAGLGTCSSRPRTRSPSTRGDQCSPLPARRLLRRCRSARRSARAAPTSATLTLDGDELERRRLWRAPAGETAHGPSWPCRTTSPRVPHIARASAARRSSSRR